MKKTQLYSDAVEARLALKIAAELSRSSAELPHDISERLRVAREAAVKRRRPETVKQTAAANAWFRAGSSAVMGSGPGGSRWFLAAIPLIALVAGLFLVEHVHLQSQVSAAAELDADLLADDLPPDAYGDAGFLEFLKKSP